MAASKSTRRPSRRARSKPQLPRPVQDRIESERRRLNKAVAVLVGAELTAEYCPDMSLVTDGISVACDLVTGAIDALDRVELRNAETNIE
jgi:hypothetical protein